MLSRYHHILKISLILVTPISCDKLFKISFDLWFLTFLDEEKSWDLMVGGVDNNMKIN